MEYVYKHQDWSNLKVLGRNRLPIRPFYCGFQSAEDCRNKRKEESGNYILLNGKWKFAYYTSPFLVPDECRKRQFDDSGWEEMPVPGHWQLNGHDLPFYGDAYCLYPVTDDPAIQADNPTGIYRRDIPVEKEAQKEYILRFDGVESAYHVWVNGQFVGYSQGSRSTAEFDITPFLEAGDNQLAVEVYKYCDGSYLENQDMWCLSGITRDVSLIIRPMVHLLDYKIDALLTEDLKNGHFRVNISAENHDTALKKLQIETTLYDGSRKLYTDVQEAETGPGTVNFLIDAEIGDIRPWSAETPYLYEAVMVLRADGKVVEAYSCSTGFRTIELREGLFYINGCALKFKGVNRHDWNGHTGRCITEEDMKRDLYMMKQNNINAVRTSHYPPSPAFLDLCDRLGFYVMEEADLECNQMLYVKKMNRISDDVLWEESYVDRAEHMVRRDKNHPSVVFWSLGNESGFGTAFTASGKFVKEYDPTRLVHYEEDRDASIADVYSTMYTRHHQLELLGRDTSKAKPHVVCEYAHAMGNGPGGLKEYWEIFERYPRLQGGFVWEWVDLGLKKTDGNGREYYTYGGDYGDYPNSGPVCCDGLVQADRRPTPGLMQLKKALEPVVFDSFSPEKGTITVHSRYDFIGLDHLKAVVTVENGDSVIYKKEIGLEGVLPHGKKELKLYSPDRLVFPDETRDWWLNISVVYIDRPVWTEQSEYEAAFHQELLKQASKDEKWTGGEPLQILEAEGILWIRGERFAVGFDRIHGRLKSYEYDGELLVKDGLDMNFWRAPVDNDRLVQEVWKEGLLNVMRNVTESVCISRTEDAVVITVKQFFAPIVLDWKVLVEAEYRIGRDGRIALTYDGVPVGTQLPETLPRIGLRFLLPGTCERASWYGRGPEETYADCKAGNRIGWFEKDVTDFYFPYVRPQETGNHEDTRWVVFQTESGRAVCFEAEDTFAFGALHYTQEALTSANHTNELEPQEDIMLCLDHKQYGLGSASCGAECLEKDRVYPEPFRFTWNIYGMEIRQESDRRGK